jgi:hypothetical protein
MINQAARRDWCAPLARPVLRGRLDGGHEDVEVTSCA